MNRNDIIEREIAEIVSLQQDYERILSVGDKANSRDGINAYHLWYNKVVVIGHRRLGPEDVELKKFRDVDNSGNGYTLRSNYHKVLGCYSLILDKLREGGDNHTNREKVKQGKKVFISHSAQDKPYADIILSLLREIGLPDDLIFYSSSAPNGIALGSGNIVDRLKKELLDYDVFAIMVHSPRYYRSIVSMNEVGAIWIKDLPHISFLTPDCTIEMMKAVINSQEVAIIALDESVEERLGEFIERLVKFFAITQLNYSKVIQLVKRFLEEYRALSIPQTEEEVTNEDQIFKDLERVMDLHHEVPETTLFEFEDEDNIVQDEPRSEISLQEVLSVIGSTLQKPINKWNLSIQLREKLGSISDEDIDEIIKRFAKLELIKLHSFANDDFGADVVYTLTQLGLKIFSKIEVEV